MQQLYARLGQIAPSSAAVLIQGETGTGKELVARAIHEASARASAPFAVVDCGALPEGLLEAELFGHTRGAFTGATEARAGVIEAANGGTVFLDEVAELPLSMQPKLLRVVESRMIRRVGETHYRPLDVRFVSATHRDLRAMARAGSFREDLYFRLAVLLVGVPPLRERGGDIPALVRHFMPDAAGRDLPPDVLLALAARPWRGNVRELRSFVERAAAFGPEEALAWPESEGAAPAGGARPPVRLPEDLSSMTYRAVREQALRDVEREYVRALLDRHGGNVSAAARASGLSRTYVHRLIRRHALRAEPADAAG
jgi:DNA-binding NtrC family response regulator